MRALIRVIYTWRLKSECMETFKDAWQQVTRQIHQSTDGALGSFCLRSLTDQNQVLTIALWRSEAQWRRFITDAKSTSMRRLHEIAEQVSVEAFQQIGDETVASD